ncbi:MAG: MASE3 domain-containing protein [Promethearchaeota archaeon]
MLNENNQTTSNKVIPEIFEVIIFSIVLLFTFFSRFYKYILFHSIAEIFSIVIAGGVFFVGWNSRKYMENSFFLVLGVSSLFIGVIDLIHTLAYTGMNIFEGYDSNLPASLWIAARYLQANSCLIASLLIKRNIKPLLLILSYLGITITLILLIFAKIFPICFIEGSGLTPFKIVSEYVIVFMLLTCLLIIIKHKYEFDKRVLSLMFSSIIVTIFAELAFTFYIGVYDFSNLVGHLFKIIAFYLLYKSIIQIGIKEPFNLLFRKIRRSELELKNIIKHSGVGITMVDENGEYLLVNAKAASELGGKPDDFIGKNLFDVFPKELAEEYLNTNRELIQSRNSRAYQRTFDQPSGRKTYWIVEQPLQDIDDKLSTLLSVTTDITKQKKAEELLKEAEHRYHTIFEQSPDGIIILDLNSLRAIEFNDAVCKILGYTREEFEKLQINDYDAIEVASETKAHLEKVLKEERDDFETKFRTKNGNIKDIYVTAKLINLFGKKYFQSIFRDITEQKKATELKMRLASIVESSEDAIIGKTLDGIITSWNKAAEKIYYYSAEEILGKSIELLSPPKHDSEILEILTRIKSGEKIEGFETERIRKDGSKVNVALTISPIKDSHNKIIGASTIARDITEKKKAEEEIRNLSKFPSENPNPVLRVNNEQILYANKIGDNLFNIYEGGAIPEILKDAIKNSLTNKEIQDLDIILNGQTYTMVITPVENADYVNIYGMDITERKKAEERLSQLVSTVSHELRTPITVLMMSIDYLTKQKDKLDKDLERKLMDGIKRNIYLLNELAEDILLIMRIDENRLQLDLKEYSPSEIIDDILNLLEPIGKEKNVTFEIDIDDNIRLKGDLKRIDQVFRIIIDNAIKYSPENSKVEITAIDNYKGIYNVNDYPGVLFKFRDYGRGIPKEDIPHIFERFFRSSNVSEIAGTGLGLAIAKDLVETHNGNIYLESELSKGTIFYVFLPIID